MQEETNQLVKDEVIAQWYIKRAYHNFNQAHRLFNLNNAESIISSYEAIEFSVKAICKILDINPHREHFVSSKILSILGTKIEKLGHGTRKEVIQLIPVLLSYTDELRNIARYGIQEKSVPRVSPHEIFRREYANSVLNDAGTIRNLLGRIEKKRRWKQKIKLGVLNGFVTGIDEQKCTKFPFSINNPDFWETELKYLSSKASIEFEISSINAVDINEQFAIILNPFGEEYPEINLRDKSIFFLIKDYVENGGVYINTGGFPFFYAWDVKAEKDNETPICDKKIIFPEKLKIEGGTFTPVKMKEYLEFTGTLLFKEFNAISTPESKPRNIFQEKEDVEKFGDLSSNVGMINEFRAMPKNTNAIPIVRAKDKISEEIYPICALKRNSGYLLLAGMNTDKEKEANLFVKAIIGFCSWMIKQL